MTFEPHFAGSNATVAGIVVEVHGKPTIIQVTAREAAAAPDLLAACKAMCAPRQTPESVDAAFKLMRAAICKAIPG